MPNTYVDLATLKGAGGLDISGTADDTRLRLLAEAVSRAVDRWCNRHFYAYQATLTFDGDGGTLLPVTDLISVDASGLKTDDNLDGTYETTWATADWLFMPRNAAPTVAGNEAGRPYHALQVNPLSNGTQEEFPLGPQTVQLAGQWGWWRHLETAAETGSGSLGSTATAFNVGTHVDVHVGHTIRVDSEQMYVKGTGTGSNLTVQRAVNGSTAGTHAAGSVVEIYRYPPAIQEAALIETGRLWKLKDAGYASQVGIPDVGVVNITRGFDNPTKILLAPFRRLKV